MAKKGYSERLERRWKKKEKEQKLETDRALQEMENEFREFDSFRESMRKGGTNSLAKILQLL